MDKSETVALSELRHVFDFLKRNGTELDDEEINQLLKDADVNGDGMINYEEFRDLFCLKKTT